VDSPNECDQQLLSVAANNAATAFQDARPLNELGTPVVENASVESIVPIQKVPAKRVAYGERC
jgi:hypothetical protein